MNNNFFEHSSSIIKKVAKVLFWVGLVSACLWLIIQIVETVQISRYYLPSFIEIMESNMMNDPDVYGIKCAFINVIASLCSMFGCLVLYAFGDLCEKINKISCDTKVLESQITKINNENYKEDNDNELPDL